MLLVKTNRNDTFNKHTNSAFENEYWNLYDEIATDYFHNAEMFLNELKSNSFGHSLDMSWKRDAERWDYSYRSLSEMVDEVLEWFTHRRQWMDEKRNENK